MREHMALRVESEDLTGAATAFIIAQVFEKVKPIFVRTTACDCVS
jgi:hypothetical protein